MKKIQIYIHKAMRFGLVPKPDGKNLNIFQVGVGKHLSKPSTARHSHIWPEVKPGTNRHSQAQPGTARHSQAQPSTGKLSQAQTGTARLRHAQQGAARHSQAQPGTARTS